MAIVDGPGDILTHGRLFPTALVVQAQDESGNAVTTYTGDVAISLSQNPTSASLGGTTTRTAVNGNATFDDLSIDQWGVGFTLTASSPTLSTVDLDLWVRASFEVLSSSNGPTCGLTYQGEALCWGPNDQGQTGVGAVSDAQANPMPVFGGMQFTSISTGQGHACAVATSAAAYCWGDNFVGQLGDGTDADKPSPGPVTGGITFESVAVGPSHSCGLDRSGNGYCWGANNGQLGNGGTNPGVITSPTAVAGGLTFSQLAAGLYHTCGIATGGAAYCWGWNDQGRLGDGNPTSYELSPVAVAGGLSFSSITVGWSHSCGLTADGSAYCWGVNNDGQLGDGTTTDRLQPTAVVSGVFFQSINAQESRTCGVTASGEAYCWGDNYDDRLGTQTGANPQTSPALVVGDLVFTSVVSGGQYSCGLVESGAAYCWGINFRGALGNGSETDTQIPAAVTYPQHN